MGRRWVWEDGTSGTGMENFHPQVPEQLLILLNWKEKEVGQCLHSLELWCCLDSEVLDSVTLQVAVCQGQGLEQGNPGYQEMELCNLQPIALATMLLLLGLGCALGTWLQCLHLTVTLQSPRVLWRLLLLIVTLCLTLAFITALLTCLLEMSTVKCSGLLRGGCQRRLRCFCYCGSCSCFSSQMTGRNQRPLGKGNKRPVWICPQS